MFSHFWDRRVTWGNWGVRFGKMGVGVSREVAHPHHPPWSICTSHWKSKCHKRLLDPRLSRWGVRTASRNCGIALRSDPSCHTDRWWCCPKASRAPDQKTNALARKKRAKSGYYEACNAVVLDKVWGSYNSLFHATTLDCRLLAAADIWCSIFNKVYVLCFCSISVSVQFHTLVLFSFSKSPKFFISVTWNSWWKSILIRHHNHASRKTTTERSFHGYKGKWETFAVFAFGPSRKKQARGLRRDLTNASLTFAFTCK